MDDGAERADPQAVLEDWITIWESELAAAATDREAGDFILASARLWASQARMAAAWMQAWQGSGDGPVSGPGPQAGPTAAAAAPDAGGQAVERLARRVEELERQLAVRPGAAPAQPG